jgi:UDP-glucose 4-epimerase
MANFAEQLKKERVLVTGGAGFVASNIVQKLLQEGATVVVLDDFYTGDRKNLPLSDPKLQLIEGSVTDLDLVKRLVKESTLIIHEAARNIIASTRNPKEDYEVNIGGTLNILLAMKENPVGRMVYSSSASIYGNPRYLPINEDDAVNLLSPYAVSKFAGENYCRAFYENYGLSTAVVRYSNVYGCRQRAENPYCGVVAKFFQAGRAGKPMQIHGDGEQTRDFTYMEDVVEATLLAALSPKAEGQVYNLGTGRETTVNQLAHLIMKITGSSAQPVYINRRDIDNIRRRVLNIEKIRRELRWTPSTTIEKGLEFTYRWIIEESGKNRQSE